MDKNLENTTYMHTCKNKANKLFTIFVFCKAHMTL